VARRSKKGRNVHGMILIDKPQELSSNRVVQVVRRLFNANRAGHTGALDPLATGMLPVCLGEATKFSQFLLDADKSYRVTAKLGERTNTSDADGEIIAIASVPELDEAALLTAISQFKGVITQTPSMFSALKHEGKPLYEYARAGIEVPRKSRQIEIYSIVLVDYKAPYLTLDVSCSKGTYIRTLVDDLGELLGCGAHVIVLRRTAVADYPAEQMWTLAELEALAGEPNAGDYSLLDQKLLPLETPVLNLPHVELEASGINAFTHGQPLDLEETSELLRIYDETGCFWGIVERKADNRYWPRRVVVYE